MFLEKVAVDLFDRVPILPFNSLRRIPHSNYIPSNVSKIQIVSFFNEPLLL